MDSTDKFNNYETADFVLDDDFRKWTLSPDAGADLFWIGWISRHPEKEVMINEAKEIILSLKIIEPVIPDFEIDSIIAATIARLDSDVIEDKQQQVDLRPLRTLYWMGGIAASLVIGMLVFFLYGERANTVYGELTANAGITLTEQYNATNKPITVRLLDGTAIVLQSHTRISYPAAFNQQYTRTVYLDGVAYFEVARNPQKPFLIYSNHIVTKVLGTHFTINSAGAYQKSEVSVASGVVAVSAFSVKDGKPGISGRIEDGVILTRNQKVTYNLTNHKLLAALSANPQLVADGRFSFASARFGVAIDAIENGYGITVVYDRKTLSDKLVTANLNNTTMYQKLEVLCKITNCHYEIVDRKIYVSQLVHR